MNNCQSTHAGAVSGSRMTRVGAFRCSWCILLLLMHSLTVTAVFAQYTATVGTGARNARAGGEAITEGPSHLFVIDDSIVVEPEHGAAGATFFVVNPGVFDSWNPEPDMRLRLDGIPLPNGKYGAAIVERFNVVHGDATILVDGVRPLALEKHLLLRGEMENEPGSYLMLAVFRNMVIGSLEVPGEDTKRLVYGPVSATSPYSFVAYDSVLKHPDESFRCGVDDAAGSHGAAWRHDSSRTEASEAEEMVVKPGAVGGLPPGISLPSPGENNMPSENEPAARVLGTATRFTVAIECTAGFYAMCGSSTTSSTNYAIANIAATSDIYRRDLGVVLYIGYLNVWTSVGPYSGGTTSTDYLNQFRTYWVANRASVTRAFAMMLHSNTSLGGIAYLDVLCDNSVSYMFTDLWPGFSFPYSGYQVNLLLLGHESGHVIGSNHTHHCSWNPPIDSCYTAEGGNCFTTTVPRRGTIMSYCAGSAGVDLLFHPRCVSLMQSRVSAASCRSTQSVPDVDAGPDRTVCQGNSVVIGQGATSGLPPYTYQWWPSGGLSSTSVVQPSASPAVTTRYYVMASDANGYRAFDSVDVTVAAPPSIDAGIDRAICANGSVQIGGVAVNGTAPYTYAWTPANGLSAPTIATPVASPSTSTMYTVVVMDALGCAARDSVLVTVGPALYADAGPDQTICPGGQVVIGRQASGGVAPYAYQWSPAVGLSSSTDASTLASPSVTSLYIVTVTDAIGCTASDSVRVTVLTVQTANLTWTGVIDQNWSTPGNWGDSCSVPVHGSNVTIPATAQYPPGAIPSMTLGNLTIDHPAGIDVTNGMILTGTLTLQRGLVRLSAPIVISPTGSIVGAGPGHHIVTGSAASLVHQGVGSVGKAGSVAYPIGPDSTTYTPITIRNTGVPDEFSIRAVADVRAYGSGGPVLQLHAVACSWVVVEGTPGGSTVTMTIQWPALLELPLFQRTSSFIAVFENGGWVPVTSPVSPSGTDPYVHTVMGLSRFSMFAVGDGISGLPVELVSFSAMREGSDVHVSWETAAESGTAGYGVERRDEQSSLWHPIAFIPARHTASAYQYRDAFPPTTRLWYRLRIADHDGRVEYSPEQRVETVEQQDALQIQMWPNPITDAVTLHINRGTGGIARRQSEMRVYVFDQLGREVLSTRVRSSEDGVSERIVLDLGHLPAGVYCCTVMDGASFRRCTIVKMWMQGGRTTPR